jgi:predicted nucleotide-binding protein
VAVDPKLKEALLKKLDVSERHLNRLITERANGLMISREHAAIAIAGEAGIGVNRYASTEDLAVIRSAKAGAATAAVTPVPAPSPPASAPSKRTGSGSSTKRATKRAPRLPASRKKVFVVHGRDEKRRKAMFGFLRSIGLTPIEWSKAVALTGKATPYVGEILDAAFKEAAAIVVLLTPDDLAQLKPEFVTAHDENYERKPTGQARPNVLFEAGMAFGRSPDHTVLTQIGGLRPFSDVGGRHVIHMNNTPEQRTELANRLGNAGCEIDLGGKDWLSEGDFS